MPSPLSPFSSPRMLLEKVWRLIGGLNSVAEVAGDRVATLEDLRKRDQKLDCKAATVTTLAAYTRTGNTILADAVGAIGAQDGVTLVAGDRLLLLNGAAGADNGPWEILVAGNGSNKFKMKRPDDANTSAKVTTGMLVHVAQGTVNGDGWFSLTTNNPITLNTTSLTFAASSGAGFATYSALAAAQGAGLIGIQDTAATFAATTVEAALAEARAKLTTLAATELTIAAGAVTATQSHHTIDTEADAASDNLDTINGLQDGQFLVVYPADAGRTVVIRSGAGNIFCPYGADISLAESTDHVLVVRSGSSIFVVGMSIAAIGGGGLGLSLSSSAPGFGAALVAYIDSTHNKIPAAAGVLQTAVQSLNTAMPVDQFNGLAAAADRVSNSTSEVAFATSTTFPANFFAVGTVAEVFEFVNIAGATGVVNFSMRSKMSGVTIATLTGVAVITNDTLAIKHTFRCIAAGASGILVVTTETVAVVAGTPVATVPAQSLIGSFDTTATKVFGVSGQWSAADALNLADLRLISRTGRLAAAVT